MPRVLEVSLCPCVGPGSADELLALDALGKPSMKRWREALRFLLGMTPDETRAFIVRTLSGFQRDVFAPHEARLPIPGAVVRCSAEDVLAGL